MIPPRARGAAATGVGIVAGGVAGGLVVGGGSFAYGHGLIASRQCNGAGCEGAAGMMLFAPMFGGVGAALGAIVGGLVGRSLGDDQIVAQDDVD